MYVRTYSIKIWFVTAQCAVSALKRLGSKHIPKDTNPPVVLKSSKSSPLNSGGGIGDQQQGGALAHFSELPTSMSSCLHSPEGNKKKKWRKN